KNVFLTKPTMDLQNEYLSFYQEWQESGEQMVPWVISKDPSDFSGMLRSLSENENEGNLPEGWVPDSTYWLVSEDRQVLGAVNIRHRLTEKLLNCGGHIGYGIRPSERRKGYAIQMLTLALEKAAELGIQKVLVVCDEDNIASAKTIIHHGGIPDQDYIEENGNVVKRFWIENN
ncbi:GNAT family N-acetyltransferase, partial [Paenibacillus donghaensis]|uniref:GNAT family N-acetyltransferase n=1 Tax=Paenibacillus donghaensis TaxID=414771 RepID=UPI001D168373